MSRAVSARRWALFVTAVAATASLALLSGCGEEEQVDPYVYAPLSAVMGGDTLSVGFLFEIDAPQFEYVRDNVALIREGNRLEFLVGDDLENRYPSLRGALIGVRKTFTPEPTHLVLQRIKRDGVVVEDSLPRPDYVLPRRLRSGEVDLETPGAALPDIEWRHSRTMEPFLPEEDSDELKDIQTGIERFVWAPRPDLPDSVRANPTADDMAWYAVFDDATLLIEDVSPGAHWMLQMMREMDYPLVGSFAMKKMFDYRDRRQEYPDLGHVVGTMRINWFRFGNTFIAGSPQT
ncbi:MAG: hypothetical protein R6X25_14295 [Candidatus Krumholzibacteriia bacterium]